MQKLTKIFIVLFVVINLSISSIYAVDDVSAPYTITATIYNMEATQYGITFRSGEYYREAQIQVTTKVNEKIDFSNAKVFNAYNDEYGSYEPDFIYKGVVFGLLYDTTYYYRVGDAHNNTWSDICSFRTAPSPYSTKEFTFLFTPDTQGPGKRWGDVLNKAFEIYPDTRFILHTGDMVEDGLNEDQWRSVLWDNRQYTTNTLINSITGNYHEDRGCELYNHFHKKLPSKQKVEKGYFYSFDYSNAHFLMLDVTDIGSDFTISEKQIEWIKRDLAETTKKWRICALHWSIYSTGPHSNYDLDKLDNLRKQLEPIFNKYDVDIVLQGHDHVYTRTKSILNGNVVSKNKRVEKEYNGYKYTSIVNQKGTTYLTGGSSGTKFYESYVPDRLNSFFEVHNSFRQSMFTAVTVTENDLIVSSYIYDEANDTIRHHETFGFTRTLTRLQIHTLLVFTISIVSLFKNYPFKRYLNKYR